MEIGDNDSSTLPNYAIAVPIRLIF